MLLRRPLAVLLLLANASAVAHLALAAHVVADSGAVVDAQPECAQPNHGNAGISHGHELGLEETECSVVALTRTAATPTPALAALIAVVQPAPAALLSQNASTPPLDVLSVAPKSSPPV